MNHGACSAKRTDDAGVRTEPRTHHEIVVCSCPVCHIAGAGYIADAFARELAIAPGGRTADGMFSLSARPLASKCSSGPAVMIDGEKIRDFDLAMVREILHVTRFKTLVDAGKGND
jgi:bidirectional [NiFe] hydrogenase diaphorase subunit